MPLTVADNYDAELRRLNDRFCATTGIRRTECVLDIGCGGGQSSRAPVAGKVLGVDISEQLLDRARERTAAEGLHNVAYELGDAQVHPFVPKQFDVVISRFGTMFFADPVAAFSNIARAARPGARLVMLVWQSQHRNEWATAIDAALSPGKPTPGPAHGSTATAPTCCATSQSDTRARPRQAGLWVACLLRSGETGAALWLALTTCEC